MRKDIRIITLRSSKVFGYLAVGFDEMRLLTSSMMISFICSSTVAQASRRYSQTAFGAVAAFSSPNTPVSNKETEVTDAGGSKDDDDDSVWNNARREDRAERTQTSSVRARQHVNPLANKFQQPTVLSPQWPSDVFNDLNRPLFVDIGCSKGGFLVDFASQRPDDYNYLGLEIRPIVVHQAQGRVKKHGLEGFLNFVGCNANVDLDRLLTIAEANGKLQVATIQFPDPHFKARHAKRRVVTPELVLSLAKFMPPGGTVFLQSDVQSVLDDMRFQFRQEPTLFRDEVEKEDEYLEKNIFGIPTEREVSVLVKNLPVYRTTFTRTMEPFFLEDGEEP
jgi:tRNA (guanine-N7-)-methyltransferase